ncbi:MAG: hypothetical protein IE909_03275 [Campylobacterales bacterium]|nr:hypothetical protein [Campylobacterales bacterium]
MIKLFFIIIVFFQFTWGNTILFSKIENIIGKENYAIHKKLIEHLFKDEYKFIINEKIKYVPLFSVLKNNGLINLRYEKPQNTILKFSVTSRPKLAYKILNDTLKGLGYRYFLTKEFKQNHNRSFEWIIEFRSEYMVDPLILSKELQQKNCKITNVENQASNHWCYDLDFSEAILSEAKKIQTNEKVKFQKPLQGYLLMVDDVKTLQVIGRNLNTWYPHIVFFSKDLQVIDVIKKERIYKGFTTKVPKDTKYIKITDLYNLINIKRGLSVIVK